MAEENETAEGGKDSASLITKTASDSANKNIQSKLVKFVKLVWIFIIESKHSNAVIAIFTVLLFLTTFSYTVFAAFYTVFAYRQWSVMVADQRPWIAPPIPSLTKPRIDPTNGSFHYGLTLSFMNSGRTPTRGLRIYAAPVLTIYQLNEVRELCDKGKAFAKQDQAGFMTFAIFPGVPYPQTGKVPNGEMDANTGKEATMDLSDIKQSDFHHEHPSIAGCVIYGWPDLQHIRSTGFFIEFESFQTSGGTLTLSGSYPVDPE